MHLPAKLILAALAVYCLASCAHVEKGVLEREGNHLIWKLASK